jgi:UDP-N-acetylglucosamine 4,6-dehydratase
MQNDLRKELNNDKVNIYIRDVRDPLSLEYAIKGVHYIFHAATLMQVPSCEFSLWKSKKILSLNL